MNQSKFRNMERMHHWKVCAALHRSKSLVWTGRAQKVCKLMTTKYLSKLQGFALVRLKVKKTWQLAKQCVQSAKLVGGTVAKCQLRQQDIQFCGLTYPQALDELLLEQQVRSDPHSCWGRQSSGFRRQNGGTPSATALTSVEDSGVSFLSCVIFLEQWKNTEHHCVSLNWTLGLRAL